eukprot:RCo046851
MPDCPDEDAPSGAAAGGPAQGPSSSSPAPASVTSSNVTDSDGGVESLGPVPLALAPNSSPTSTGASARPPVTPWDPFEDLALRRPRPGCLQRLHKEVRSILLDPLPGILVLPDPVHGSLVHALISGPSETPYEGGFFYFVLSVPDTYPFDPPKVRLMTTGEGTVRFNPNLYPNGKVCLSILGTWPGPAWTPGLTLGAVLLSIQSLMNDRPYHNEPGFEQGSAEAAEQYNALIQHETLRIAVCDNVDPLSASARAMPPEFQKSVQAMFLSLFEFYEGVCRASLALDGRPLEDPFTRPHTRGVFAYAQLLRRLVGIKKTLSLAVPRASSSPKTE